MDQQMSRESCPSDRSLFMRNSLGNGEDSSGQATSDTGMSNDMQHSQHASEEGREPDKTSFTTSSSPLASQTMYQGYSADVIAPLSSDPSTENVAKGDSCMGTTVSMVSSDATHDVGVTGMAFPALEPVVERQVLSPLSSDGAPNSQQNLVDVAPVDLPPDTGPVDSQTAPVSTILGGPSFFAAVRTEPSEPSAGLSVTHCIAYPEYKLSSAPTITASSSDTCETMGLPSVEPDARLTSLEDLCEYAHACDAESPRPALGPAPGFRLTHLPPVDTLDSSPPHGGQNSDVSMQLTPPPSSPWTEFSVIVVAEQARDKEADFNSTHPEIDDYSARTPSSPNFILGDDESSLSSSPPLRKTIGTKRAQYYGSDEESTSAKPVKRIRMNATMSSPLRDAPAPRRATLASQRLSRKKLVAPFRSPLLTKTTSRQLVSPTSLGEVPQEQVSEEPRAKYKSMSSNVQEVPAGGLKADKSLVRSSRAAAQFKSPLTNPPAHASRTIILPNQTIMSLERKLTILKRAIKIKRDGDEDHLERLTKKWRDAGREAAYELWGIVRDLTTEGGDTRGNGSDTGWGWGDQDERCGAIGEHGPEAEAGSADQQENTLGVMLRKLGIAPETLGWNDEEETFVDDE